MVNVDRTHQLEQLETVMADLRRVMLRAKNQQLAAYDLTPSQAEVLLGLDHTACSTGEVAGALGVTSSAATQTIETLVRRGYIERSSDAGDRRVVRLTLTTAGRALTAQLQADRRQQLAELISRLTPDQTAALTTALRTLINVVNQPHN